MASNRLLSEGLRVETGAPPSLFSAYSALVLLVALASVAAMVTLSLDRFDVPLVLAGAGVASALVLAWGRIRIEWTAPRLGLAVVLIGIAALLLRSDLDPHLSGGQDQGLYSNMSETLLRSRAVDFEDGFRAALSSEDRVRYDQAGLAGVTLIDGEKSLYTVPFYPLHPAWMAISKWAFGNGHHTLSLLLFAAMGIIGAYVLAFRLFGDRVSALLAALFIAINPAMVFFAKFPVTEIVAFAFTVNGFAFFLKAIDAHNRRASWVYWLIAVACFNGLFYTRMQFFMYVPFMGLLAAYAVLARGVTRERRILILGFVGALLAGFALSLAYYYWKQPLLFEGVVLGHMSKIVKLLVLGAVGSALLAAAWTIRSASMWRAPAGAWLSLENGVARLSRYAPWTIPLVLLASIPSIVALYKTGSLAPFAWQLPVGGDPMLVRYHALYRLALFLSPIGLALLAGVGFLRRQWSGPALMGFLFLASVWAATLLQPAIPYLYYYGRYLVSEMVPYSLILCAGVLGYLWQGRARWLALSLVVAQCAYFLTFSLAQYRNVEGEDGAFFERVVSHVTPNDVLLTAGLDDRHHVGLRLYHGLSLFPISAGQSLPPAFLTRMTELAKQRGGHLFLATDRRSRQLEPSLVEQIPFRSGILTNHEHYRQNDLYMPAARSRLLLPYKYVRTEQQVSLYRVVDRQLDAVFNTNCVDDLDLTSNGALVVSALKGFSVPEEHGRWTDGTLAIYSCQMRADDSTSKVWIDATAFTPGTHRQRVIASVNGGEKVEFDVGPEAPTRRMEVPAAVGAGETLVLRLELPNAISPAKAGVSADPRVLAISINDIEMN